jgi:4a-hydroxytetrahydrobiopterin dehydratase
MDTTDDLPAADLADRLVRCPAWELDGKEIGRTFEFESFPEAIDFVNEVAGIAEDAGHHPDIDIRYLRVSLRLTTHSRGALTGKDFELARRIDNFVD